MNKYINKPVATIGYLVVTSFVLFGLSEALLQIRPFWLDEWFIIYNIKFKPVSELWGELDYMQQFPRVYIQIVNFIGGLFNYSYQALRLPSFIVHVFAIILCFKIGRQLFSKQAIPVFIFVLAYLSYKSSGFYYVQVKQYTMEMLLGVVAIWQVMILHKLFSNNKISQDDTLFLYLSVALAPFFSYTYPILAVSFVVVVLLRLFVRHKQLDALNKKHIISVLLISFISITAFYWVDVRQVMQDAGMQNYWQEYILGEQASFAIFFKRFFELFAHLGSGALFEIIFGIVGIAGFLLSLIRFKKNMLSDSVFGFLTSFAAVLIIAILVLYGIGKLPLGAHRLNAFATPVLALLFIYSISTVREIKKADIPATILSLIVFLGLAGNIVSSAVNEVLHDNSKKKYAIYDNASNAIDAAYELDLPIVVRRDVTFPHDVHQEINGKLYISTHPNYKVENPIPIYPVDNLDEAQKILDEHSLESALYIMPTTYDAIAQD